MEVSVDWFKNWFGSPYYHQLYANRNEQEAASFINRLIEHLRPPADSFMIDIGCGKGRHTKILSSYGFDVTGIDLSFDNILEAKNNETDNLHFFQHDMRLPFWINYFNYSFNLFTSFGYFRTKREHYNAVRTMVNAVKPGGLLIFDYHNVQYTEDHLEAKTYEEVAGSKFHLSRWQDKLHFYKEITIENDELKEPLVYVEKVAKLTLKDFKEMFTFHKLELQQVYGDYQLDNYDEKSSPRLVMVAGK